MNNEEKILSMLGQLSGQMGRLEDGQASLAKRMDRLEDSVAVLKEDVAELKKISRCLSSMSPG